MSLKLENMEKHIAVKDGKIWKHMKKVVWDKDISWGVLVLLKFY